MKKLSILFFLAFVVFITGCEKENITIVFEETNYQLRVDEELELVFEVEGTDEIVTIVYTIEDSNIVTVEEGKLIALQEGTTSIIVSLQDIPEVQVVLTVVVLPRLARILTEEELTLFVGEELSISYTKEHTEDAVVFSTSNASIATVDLEGLVFGLSAGVVQIVLQLENDATVRTVVTVLVVERPIEILVNPVVELFEGDSWNIEYDVLYNVFDRTIVITSNNLDVITIDGPQAIAHQVGTAIITIAIEGTSFMSNILVDVVERPMEIVLLEEVTIEYGETHSLLVEILHAKEEVTLEFQTSDETIVSIDNGDILGMDIGIATIMVTISGTEIKATIQVIVTYPEVSIVFENDDYLFVSEEIPILFSQIGGIPNEVVTFTSSNPSLLEVRNNEVFVAKEQGMVNITATIERANYSVIFPITILDLTVASMEITASTSDIYILEEFLLEAIIYPLVFPQEVTWSSSDTSIMEISPFGRALPKKSGQVVITATSVEDPSQGVTMNIQIKADPIRALELLHVENPMRQYVSTYGYNPSIRYQWVTGSVNQYFNSSMNLVENLVPINTNTYTGTVATRTALEIVEPQKKVRPGILHEETKYIIYHDTGNHTPGANAQMHANYMVGADNASNRARSWHFSVDEHQIIQHIPDNEVSWQGDSYEAYAMGIGIETCVDFGSDLYTTWQRTAKLIASLLVKHNLGIDAILQHYDTSGKNCPQTLRMNNLYNHAIDLVRAEYLMRTEFSNFSIAFTSLSPNYVDNRGRVIALPETATRVGYIVRAFRAGYNESKVLYSVLPGLDGTTTIDANEEDLASAEAVDQQILRLPTNVFQTTEPQIVAAREAYEALTDVQKTYVTTYQRLLEKEIALYNYSKVATSVFIKQVFVSNQEDNTFAMDYIELYNTTNQEINISNWTLEVNDGEKIAIYTFGQGTIIPTKRSYLIYFEKEEGKNIDPRFPLPDAALLGFLPDDAGSITLKNAEGMVIDLFGYGENAPEYEDAPFLGFGTKAMDRVYLLDTNRNNRDFIRINPTPTNRFLQTVVHQISGDFAIAKVVDQHISMLLRPLQEDDEALLQNTIDMVEGLTSEQRSLLTRYSLLEQKILEFQGLGNPDLRTIQQALQGIPSQLLMDFTFPTDLGVTWEYKAGEDTTFFDLQTGTHLKTSYAAKPISLIARYGSEMVEFVINFGVAKVGETVVFSSGASSPSAGRLTAEGKASMQEQLNTAGFGGVAIAIDGKVYFIGKDAYIALVAPVEGSILTQVELRPRGATNGEFYNMGLVNGQARDYMGTGALYHNTSNIDLTFNISDTYGRNNADVYGYFKVIFRPDGEGTFTVLKGFGSSGTNESKGNTMVTLKPGDFLWTPHTYEANYSGGTWLVQGGLGGTEGVLIEGRTLEIRFYNN